MALTVAKVTGADRIEGNKKVKVRTITFDSSYPTGGEALTASTLGFRKVEEVRPHGVFRNTDGTLAVPVSYDHTNSKLLAYQYNGASAGVAQLLEVANTTDLSAFSGRVTVVGT